MVSKYAVYKFNTAKACKQAERDCKNNLICRVVSKEDLPDGWTETVLP